LRPGDVEGFHAVHGGDDLQPCVLEHHGHQCAGIGVVVDQQDWSGRQHRQKFMLFLLSARLLTLKNLHHFADVRRQGVLQGGHRADHDVGLRCVERGGQGAKQGVVVISDPGGDLVSHL